MDRNTRIIRALTELAVTIGADFPTARHLGYLRALADVRTEAIEHGCREAAKVCEYMPTPAKLTELARLYRLPQPPPLKQLPDLTPPDVAKERLQALFNRLNREFGTSLKV